jgi:hypothetical protein
LRREERVTDFLPVGWFNVPKCGMPAVPVSLSAFVQSVLFIKKIRQP